MSALSTYGRELIGPQAPDRPSEHIGPAVQVSQVLPSHLPLSGEDARERWAYIELTQEGIPMWDNCSQDHLSAVRSALLIARAAASRLRSWLPPTSVSAGVLVLLIAQWAPPAQAKNLLFYEPALATHYPYASPDMLTEATVAVAQGHTVTLADAAQWSSMTTEQFASYDAIVFPDSFFNENLSYYQSIYGAAESNKATWSAAIKGPRIIFGVSTLFGSQTYDGTFHWKGQAEQLVANGLNFAASGPGTGLYMSVPPYYAWNGGPPVAVSILGALGTFLVRTSFGEGYGGKYILAPSHPAMSGLTFAGTSYLNGTWFAWFSSVPSSFERLMVDPDWGRLFGQLLPVIIASPGASPSLGLRAGFGNGPNDPGTQSTSVGETPPVARVPLGSTFFLQLTTTDQSGSVVPVRSTFTLEQAAIAPAITEPALFRNAVVLEFDRARSSDIKFFQAVHLGSVFVRVTPEDTSITPVTVQIQVNNPLRLGSTQGQVDATLIDLAHRRGIPPQMLKGQVQRESRFDEDAYRYEPLSADMRYMSRGQNFRTQDPYRDYRLRTSDGLAQGADILRADISPRSIYSTRRGPITDRDELVSAREIYEVNDPAHHWSRFSPARAQAVRRNPEVLNFTAQTPIAASYGFLQIMYATAIAPMRWGGVNGRRNPSLLFDTEQNVESGGGSVVLGSGYLRRIFSRANPRVSVTDPSFSGRGALETAFVRAFNYYNRGRTSGPYGPAVLTFSRSYTPAPSTPIFQ